MSKNITIKDIQEWEKSFVKRKGVVDNEELGIKIAICKLMEEVGEVSKAVLEEKWEEVPAEVSDVIVFACKIANIAEKFHKTEELSEVLSRKIDYCEERTYNKDTKKFDKPQSEEFK
jgi:NTP pyrophosphatase (non-canonical NTP hydrolase)